MQSERHIDLKQPARLSKPCILPSLSAFLSDGPPVMNFTFPAIGIVRSCFKEKFGIPRQPGLAPLAEAEIEMLPEFAELHAFTGLEEVSHLWVQFVFHANARDQWKPRVRPPRLGGNKTLGVFATRSPTRPAPIGLSVVRFRGIVANEGKVRVQISGVDLLEGTPVLDIKPYVPYVDAVPDAVNLIAPAPPVAIPVNISPTLAMFCAEHDRNQGGDLAQLIIQILQQDPRPSYQQPDPQRTYGMRLLALDVRWRYALTEHGCSIELTDIRPI